MFRIICFISLMPHIQPSRSHYCLSSFLTHLISPFTMEYRPAITFCYDLKSGLWSFLSYLSSVWIVINISVTIFFLVKGTGPMPTYLNPRKKEIAHNRLASILWSDPHRRPSKAFVFCRQTLRVKWAVQLTEYRRTTDFPATYGSAPLLMLTKPREGTWKSHGRQINLLGR